MDPDYLTALLNSGVTEFLVRLFAPLVKDGFSRYRKQFVKTLPVPNVSLRERRAIAKLVDNRDISEMNSRIARLFGLSSVDAALVDRFVLGARGHRGLDEVVSKAA